MVIFGCCDGSILEAGPNVLQKIGMVLLISQWHSSPELSHVFAAVHEGCAHFQYLMWQFVFAAVVIIKLIANLLWSFHHEHFLLPWCWYQFAKNFSAKCRYRQQKMTIAELKIFFRKLARMYRRDVWTAWGLKVTVIMEICSRRNVCGYLLYLNSLMTSTY